MSSRSSLLLPVLLALAGCGSSDQEESADPAAAAQSTEAGTEQKASQFPGYPVLVELSSLDSRVASSLEGQTAEGKAVALAPGLYTAYNTQFRDLDRYYQDPVLYGDQMMMQEHFPMSPGTFWGGRPARQPGTQGLNERPQQQVAHRREPGRFGRLQARSAENDVLET